MTTCIRSNKYPPATNQILASPNNTGSHPKTAMWMCTKIETQKHGNAAAGADDEPRIRENWGQ